MRVVVVARDGSLACQASQGKCPELLAHGDGKSRQDRPTAPPLCISRQYELAIMHARREAGYQE